MLSCFRQFKSRLQYGVQTLQLHGNDVPDTLVTVILGALGARLGLPRSRSRLWSLVSSRLSVSLSLSLSLSLPLSIYLSLSLGSGICRQRVLGSGVSTGMFQPLVG